MTVIGRWHISLKATFILGILLCNNLSNGGAVTPIITLSLLKLANQHFCFIKLRVVGGSKIAIRRSLPLRARVFPDIIIVHFCFYLILEECSIQLPALFMRKSRINLKALCSLKHRDLSFTTVCDIYLLLTNNCLIIKNNSKK